MIRREKDWDITKRTTLDGIYTRMLPNTSQC